MELGGNRMIESLLRDLVSANRSACIGSPSMTVSLEYYNISNYTVKKLYNNKIKARQTITKAKMAIGRFNLTGSVSFFMIRIIAPAKATIINITIDDEVFIHEYPNSKKFFLFPFYHASPQDSKS